MVRAQKSIPYLETTATIGMNHAPAHKATSVSLYFKYQ